MINDKYAKAYKEVLEIIKFFPEEEYNKIPKEKIEFFEKNMDPNHIFTINPKIDLSEQNISKEANAVIIGLFQDYYATEEQKVKINKILELNQKQLEEEKKEKYNPDDIFKKRNTSTTEEVATEPLPETAMIEYKENFFIKFKNFILKILHRR